MKILTNWSGREVNEFNKYMWNPKLFEGIEYFYYHHRAHLTPQTCCIFWLHRPKIFRISFDLPTTLSLTLSLQTVRKFTWYFLLNHPESYCLTTLSLLPPSWLKPPVLQHWHHLLLPLPLHTCSSTLAQHSAFTLSLFSSWNISPPDISLANLLISFKSLFESHPLNDVCLDYFISCCKLNPCLVLLLPSACSPSLLLHKTYPYLAW